MANPTEREDECYRRACVLWRREFPDRLDHGAVLAIAAALRDVAQECVRICLARDVSWAGTAARQIRERFGVCLVVEK